ncbi:matrix metalloproteinase-17-like [Strongylocentrotus purpuratus]|uniref:Peptidase metallopeptidase domain-containing protein n=1 Tax=Strongylocentrotus purpuratus TaxID=7668 RepID=A0A7M7NFC0_STRPU|nr:matrix metalloproteinase-17-like [Strongylocentrotus purpuratus]
MMNTPRCGLPDVDPENPETDPDSDADSPEGLEVKRKKRYVLANSRWEKTDLTWRIDGSRPTPDLEADHVKRIMKNALQFWDDASALTFREQTGSDADIQISFGVGEHGDTYNFDGPGGTLAHAFYPTSPPVSIAGDAHFDDSETFSDGSAEGTNLLQVAIHEFGHSLGLQHSDVNDAIMYPYYRGYIPDITLDRDDIAGIQALYGENTDDPEQPSTVDCSTVAITWATSTQDGRQYLCNDTHCYRMSDNVVDDGYPKLIQEEFPGLPDDPDASFYYETTGKTYIFKGSEVWRLANQTIDSGYPMSISSEFPDLPSDLSAAFVWHINKKIYFVKDTMYYRVSAPGTGLDIDTENPYPRLFSDWWRGLPNTIDAAFQWSDSRTYMFAGSQYYLLHPWLSKVSDSLPPYPRDTAVWWFDCDPDDGISDNGFNGAMSVVTPSIMVAICVFVLNALLFLN